MSSFKSSRDIQKKEGGPDTHDPRGRSRFAPILLATVSFEMRITVCIKLFFASF